MDFATRRAFTLLELIIALAISAIVIGLAAPSMAEVYRKHQLNAYQSDLMRLIVQARHQALSNGKRVTVCAMDNQGRCVSLNVGILHSFEDVNGNRILDPGETLLYTLPIPNHMRVSWGGTNPKHSLHFSAQGTTFLSNGSFTLCHQARLDRHGRLTLSKQGRARMELRDGSCPLS